MLIESHILNVLKVLSDPLSQKDIITSGVLQGLHIKKTGDVSFILEINSQYTKEGIKLKEQAESLVKQIPGVKTINIVLTTQMPNRSSGSLKRKLANVAHTLLIASGKGGVGKSTTAVNLACALQMTGLKVGLLDGDVYGPSLPRLLGYSQKPTTEDGKINPLEIQGLKCISMGFMMGERMPAIWRGPMVHSAIQQMLHHVNWGILDVLIIDLPPGTGDVHLTLTQKISISGAIIVSTPQDLALIDARRAIEMFVKMDTPLLGLVENMSFFLCPHCDKRSDIFEHGGVHKEAQFLRIPFLAEIPLHISIRETSEKGIPIVHALPNSREAHIYREFAQKVLYNLDIK